MNLVKWIRKNERKLMASLLVLIMIAFVGGSALQQILKSINLKKITVANYSGGRITIKTLTQAQNELDILKSLSSDQYLALLGGRDARGLLLGQLLFPETFRAELLSNDLKRKNWDQQEIDEFYFQWQKSRSAENWFLLKAEAAQAGCAVSITEAKEILTRVTAMVSSGRRKTSDIISGLVQKYGITEDGILSIFADLLAVTKYANMVTNSENLTVDQIKSGIAMGGIGPVKGEQINAEYVKVSASRFTKDLEDPSELELNEQFTKYKDSHAGFITDDNPYGFGYKLPAMVNAQYIVIKLDDVIDTVTDPTDDEMMDYYTSNAAEFTREIPADPADPTSTATEEKESYAKAASRIRTTLKRSKAIRKSDMVIAEAVEKTTANYGSLDLKTATSDELKDLAVDYAKVAQELTTKHGFEVYTGTTGLTSASDLARDQVFRNLSIENRGSVPQSITSILFTAEGLEAIKPGPFSRAIPKQWENLGPAKNFIPQIGFTHAAIVRVIDTAKEAAPDNINYTYSINRTSLGNEITPTIVSIKDNVIKDVKLVKAMETAKSTAEQLAKLAGENGFKAATDALNAENKDKGIILFSQKMTDRTRIPDSYIKSSIAQQAVRNPGVTEQGGLPSAIAAQSMLIDKLYDLVDSDQNELKDVNKVMFVEPDASYYVIKDVSRTPVSIQDYEKNKLSIAYFTDMQASEILSLHHFNVSNLQARMGYEIVKPDTKDDETDQGTN